MYVDMLGQNGCWLAATPLYMEIMTEIFVVYTNGITKISSPQVHENMVQLCIERSSSPKKVSWFQKERDTT